MADFQQLILMIMILYWIITIDSEIQENIIIYFSKSSITNHTPKIIVTMLTLCIVLCAEFYQDIMTPHLITTKTIPDIITSIVRLVIKEHILLLLCLYSLVHFDKIQRLAVHLLTISKTFFLQDMLVFAKLILLSWFLLLLYSIYTQIKRIYEK